MFVYRVPAAVGSNLTYDSMQQVMRRFKSTLRPPSVKNLDELHEVLSGPAQFNGFTVAADGEPLLSIRCQQFNSVVITSQRLLHALSESETLYADTTFDVVPRGFGKQILTLHGEWHGYVGLCAVAFMQKQDAEAYKEVLRSVLEVTPLPRLVFYMGDWDAALRRAMSDVLPGLQLRGCHFHYSQALIKKASSDLHLARYVRSRGAVRSIIVTFCALPLLPAHEIWPAFSELVERIEHLGNELCRHRMSQFAAYFSHYWLDTITPELLSLFRVANRTNNAVESMNAIWDRDVENHPNIWDLLRVFVRQEHDVIANK